MATRGWPIAAFLLFVCITWLTQSVLTSAEPNKDGGNLAGNTDDDFALDDDKTLSQDVTTLTPLWDDKVMTQDDKTLNLPQGKKVMLQDEASCPEGQIQECNWYGGCSCVEDKTYKVTKDDDLPKQTAFVEETIEFNEDNPGVGNPGVGSPAQNSSESVVPPAPVDDEDLLQGEDGSVYKHQDILPGVTWNEQSSWSHRSDSTSCASFGLLLRRYSQCSTCMETKSEYSEKCDFLDTHAKSFKDSADKVYNLLMFGCRGSGDCCHKPDPSLASTLGEMTTLNNKLERTLKDQCSRCPVDCEWGDWTDWSDCPPCAENEYRTRSRHRITQAKFGGSECQGDETETKQCPRSPIEQGFWSQWGPFSSCSASCGGYKTQTRTCTSRYGSSVSHHQVIGCFKNCIGDSMRVEACGQEKCCRPRQWSSWGAWEACSDPADGPSVKVKRRECIADSRYPHEPMCAEECYGPKNNTSLCCKDSHWGDWSGWGQCVNRHTGHGCHGQRSRSRSCIKGDNCGQNMCKGSAQDFIDCNLKGTEPPCCALREWSSWSRWSPCSVTTGPGSRSRSRVCRVPDNDLGQVVCDDDCRGNPTEIEKCYGVCECPEPLCEIEWSPYTGECTSQHCGKGVEMYSYPKCRQSYGCKCPVLPKARAKWIPCPMGSWEEWGPFRPPCPECGAMNWEVNRTRVCNRQIPQCGCLGRGIEQKTVDCPGPYWLPWSQWSGCSGSNSRCGGNVVEFRTRQCSERYRSHCCEGENREERTKYCPGPSWGTWGEWSQCGPNECTHIPTRRRYCQASGRFHSCTCDGRKVDEQRGNPITCKTECDCTWSGWSSCSVTCGTGIRTRTKSCTSKCGASCRHLERTETERCDSGRIPECECSDWRVHGECSTSCGPGVLRKTRTCVSKCGGTCPRTEVLEPCNNGPCTTCKVTEWEAWSRWSQCTCDVRTITRTRRCRVTQWGEGSQAGCPRNPCTYREEDREQRSCTPTDCVEYQPIGNCTCTCSIGQSLQSRICVDKKSGSIVPLSNCLDHLREQATVFKGYCDVNTDQTCRSGVCITSCKNQPDGKYHSCNGGCSTYIECAGGYGEVKFCNQGYVFDVFMGFKCVSQNKGRSCSIVMPVDDCTNHKDGKYPSSKGCGYYVTCSQGRLSQNSCPKGMEYNHHYHRTDKYCQSTRYYPSPTCGIRTLDSKVVNSRTKRMAPQEMYLNDEASVDYEAVREKVQTSLRKFNKDDCLRHDEPDVCKNRKPGVYASCRGCGVEFECLDDSTYAERWCPDGGEFDTHKKQCLSKSSSCVFGG